MENNQPEKQDGGDQSNAAQPQPQISSESTFCSKCKLFYGNPQMNFMCSKCFKESGGVLPQPNKQANSAQNESNTEEKKEKQEEVPAKPIQEDTTRCWICKKKIGLTGLKCRCDYYYCQKHRYPEEHECQFDFNGFYKEKLKKENQKVVSKKVDNI